MAQRASASASSAARRACGGKKPSRPRPRLPRFAALALALAVLLALAGCEQSAVQPPPAHPTPAARRLGVPAPATPTAVPPPPTTAPLPAFTDWRAAYLSSDGSVHVVTLDGKTDLTGPALPPFKINGLILASAGASPDGHLLAYNSTDLLIVSMAGAGHGTVRDVFTRVVDAMAWSPDSRQLALNDGSGGLSLLKTTEEQLTSIPGLSINGDGQPVAGEAFPSLLGWLDASHLAIGGYPLSGISSDTGLATAYAIRSLDVTSGTWRTIATINSPGLGAPRITLSPDGSRAVFSNSEMRDEPFTPIVDEINTVTGAITPLPTILRATSGPNGPQFFNTAWRPGTHQLAVTAYGTLKTWLLDLDYDTATLLLSGVYFVQQWSPNGNTFIISSSDTAAAGLGPHDLSAVTFGPGGQPRVTLLTHEAMSFPFLGFVRTA